MKSNDQQYKKIYDHVYPIIIALFIEYKELVSSLHDHHGDRNLELFSTQLDELSNKVWHISGLISNATKVVNEMQGIETVVVPLDPIRYGEAIITILTDKLKYPVYTLIHPVPTQEQRDAAEENIKTAFEDLFKALEQSKFIAKGCFVVRGVGKARTKRALGSNSVRIQMTIYPEDGPGYEEGDYEMWCEENETEKKVCFFANAKWVEA